MDVGSPVVFEAPPARCALGTHFKDQAQRKEEAEREGEEDVIPFPQRDVNIRGRALDDDPDQP